jgi:hypothetical protein
MALAGIYLNPGQGKMMPDEDLRVLPSFTRVLLELPVFILVREIGTYYSHR